MGVRDRAYAGGAKSLAAVMPRVFARRVHQPTFFIGCGQKRDDTARPDSRYQPRDRGLPVRGKRALASGRVPVVPIRPANAAHLGRPVRVYRRLA